MILFKRFRGRGTIVGVVPAEVSSIYSEEDAQYHYTVIVMKNGEKYSVDVSIAEVFEAINNPNKVGD